MLHISESQREELERWAHSQSLSAADVLHARLILALAAGRSYSDIIAALQTTAPTIVRWKKRFEELGVEGLQGRHQGSQPRVTGPAVTEKIVSLIGHNPSYRKLARELALSKSTVQRLCAQNHSKPHRLQRYMARLDSGPEIKPINIIGLYLHAPQHVTAFSVGEPISGPGFQSLRTALDACVRSSPTLGPRHTSRQFVLFRDTLITRFRMAPQIHFVLDNVSAHKTMDVELFLATHPNVYLHFLQSWKTWVAQVGMWLSETHTEFDGRNLDLRKYLQAYAKSAEPFWWILGK